ncbi:uncharacterized protein N7479_001654 [Penicillium vulpinum]|uniref:Uncharacterized protein n=1 Tax=Penicillium vulpinum TaxID=29845 RepID=A0A1V6QZQ7_9EURO|nr:uncharacterized protein N7479_001654 [Penicillium vulpinum]KAJ5971736.1 hypothetical protein N7479_001654 [Penicillium vulpinum]OQD94631.1 hypothetical protein PENVUL_c134G00503 [Penicillium vulpinum]
MPWFGVIRDDHERLETAEAGTWEEISDAHRDMCLATRKPSGESSQKRAVSSYTCPGVTHLTGLGDLSDALLGRIKWSEWSVISELNLLFGEDQQAAYNWSFFHLLKEGLPVPEPHLEYQKDLGSDISDASDVDGDNEMENEIEDDAEGAPVPIET